MPGVCHLIVDPSSGNPIKELVVIIVTVHYARQSTECHEDNCKICKIRLSVNTASGIVSSAEGHSHSNTEVFTATTIAIAIQSSTLGNKVTQSY